MRIAVTGFGPFGDFSTNPSSIVVDGLRKSFDFEPVELITETIDVDYSKAVKCSNKYCDELAADFVIHVGVDRNSNRTVHLERKSFKDGYVHADICGMVPPKNQCQLCEAADDNSNTKTLETIIDCDRLKMRLENVIKEMTVEVDISDNPGRYLCAYIYYCSLLKSGGNSLFVHIPPFDDECTPEMLVEILKQIVIEIYDMKMLNNNEVGPT